MLGALQIATSQLACSANFAAKVVGTANYVLLSAGHCGTAGTEWYHKQGPLANNQPKCDAICQLSAYDIGAGGRNAFGNNSSADAQRIGLRNGDQTSSIYTDGTIHDITSVQAEQGAYVGEPTCVSGSGGEFHTGMGVHCGTVRNADLTTFSTEPGSNVTTTLVHQIKASYTSCAGDSGGPIYDGHMAMGVQSSTELLPGEVCAHPSFLSKAAQEESQLDVTILTG